MSHAAAFCIALLAGFFIVAAAAGSALLATIPPQNSGSTVSANMQTAAQDSNKDDPETRGAAEITREEKEIPKLASPPASHTGIKESILIRRTMPIYPQEARMQNIEGTVELKCFVDADGMVKYARIIKGDPILAQAAIDAVKQWQYSPMTVNGQPWPNEASVNLVFKMR